jgi:hypothetical protein
VKIVCPPITTFGELRIVLASTLGEHVFTKDGVPIKLAYWLSCSPISTLGESHIVMGNTLGKHCLTKDGVHIK